MPSAKPARNLTPVLCQRLHAEMLKACEAVAAGHGLVIEPRDITGVDLRWMFDASLGVSTCLASVMPRNKRKHVMVVR